MKTTFLLLALCFLGLTCPGAHAGQKAQNPSMALPSKPWVASEKDIAGRWCMNLGTDDGWYATFHLDHTVTVIRDGFISRGPVVSSWKLENNHVLIDEAPLTRFFGRDLIRNVGTTGSRDDTFGRKFGCDLKAVQYQNNVVLYSTASESDVQKFGLIPWFCFWQYDDNKKGLVLPRAARDLAKQGRDVIKRMR